MSAHEVFAAGVLRQQWDDGTRTYTEWDENGVRTEQRPYTAEEHASADAAVQGETVIRLTRELQAAQYALTPTETNALLSATAPPAGESWRQPSGATDAYPLGHIVSHVGKQWESLVTANVWEPPTSWREVGNEWPDWVQPTGAHDSYAAGAQVTHNEGHWTSDIDANVWEPGVYGWSAVPDSRWSKPAIITWLTNHGITGVSGLSKQELLDLVAGLLD